VLGLQLGGLIGGAVITDYVFALPGVGRLVVDAVFARDYPLVQGVVLLIALGYILTTSSWTSPMAGSTRESAI
jgi:peptide/nickel transport system permease protein